MTKNLLSFGGITVAAFLLIFSFSSCHDEEVENVSELAYRHAYEDNFVKQYGEINPNQTWDFSSYAKRYNLNGALTRATMDDSYKSIASDGYYHIPSEITDYITTNFVERVDNASKTQAFTLMADKACKFEVAYVYQGRSEPDFDLYYAIYNLTDHSLTKTKLFSKGDVYVSNNDTDYNLLGTTWVNGDAPSTMDYDYAKTETELIEVPANSFVYFYIKITDTSTRSNGIQDNRQFGWIGDELASIDNPHTIGLVPIDTPANIKEIDSSYEAYLLAIDDFCVTCQKAGIVTDSGQDFQDFNDVMFLIAGNVPEPSTVEPGVIKTIIAKRYMIEDLYAYDYDFNDIVVDATQITTTPYTFVHPTTSNPNGQFVIDSEKIEVKQSAMMKHLCGTLPFQITVGGTSFNKVTDPTDQTQTLKQLDGETTANTLTPAGSAGGNWEPDYGIDITDWDPETNNITAAIMANKFNYSQSVLWNDGWTDVWTSEFPKAGGVPYIIAVDTNVEWMGEKNSIFLAHPDWTGGDMSTSN